jgi:hypothetical protein
MIDVERQLQEMFDRRQADVRGAVGPADARTVARRARRRQASNGVLAAAVAILVLIGAGAAWQALAPGAALEGPASRADTLPPGPIASLTQRAAGMAFRLKASGTLDGRLCLDLSWSEGTDRSCFDAHDLSGAGFAPYRSQATGPWFVAYGVVPESASQVALRYAEGGSTEARMATIEAGSLSFRIYLLASPRPVFRGLLGAWDASGDPVGEPEWTWWGSTASKATWNEILAQCGCGSKDRHEG